MAKETKAQRVERIKQEKDGLDVIKDIHRYAQSDQEIDPEDIDRFKWYGLYTQNKNLQGPDDSNLYFMLRIRLEHGELTLKQLEVIASISRDFSRQTAAFTTRQDVQIHFVHVRDIPEIFDRLKSVGISSQYACGDVPRNAVSCPVNGLDHDQICDVRSIVEDVNAFLSDRAYSNLPRKFKVGVSGCSKHCMNHEIQDVAFNAFKNDEGDILFDVTVGGGLASNRRVADSIATITEQQILPVLKAVVEIYKDHGDRSSRRKARVGHIVEKWGKEKFTQTVQERLDFTLEPSSGIVYTPYVHREHFGIHESLIEGQSYIGCAINDGRIGAEGLEHIRQTLQQYGATTIKVTTSQNFVIVDAPTENAEAIVKALQEKDIDSNPSTFKARTLSCTGMNFCKLAISETKNLAHELVDHLEKRFPDLDQTISMSVNGCPNACGQPYVVDIGLLGCKVKHEGKTVSGFELLLGGNLKGDESQYAVHTGVKFIPEEAAQTIENLIVQYQKSDHKSFQTFLGQKVNERSFI